MHSPTLVPSRTQECIPEQTDNKTSTKNVASINQRCHGFHHITQCPRTDCNKCGRKFATVEERQQHFYEIHMNENTDDYDNEEEEVPRKHSVTFQVPTKDSRSNENSRTQGTKRSFDSSNSSSDSRSMNKQDRVKKAFKAIVKEFLQETENESEHQYDNFQTFQQN